MKLHLTPTSARAIQSLGKSSLAAALEAARKVRQTAEAVAAKIAAERAQAKGDDNGKRL